MSYIRTTVYLNKNLISFIYNDHKHHKEIETIAINIFGLFYFASFRIKIEIGQGQKTFYKNNLELCSQMLIFKPQRNLEMWFLNKCTKKLPAVRKYKNYVGHPSLMSAIFGDF